MIEEQGSSGRGMGPTGRTVVVTGATGSAGTATVRRLRSAGATVVAAGRSRDRLRELVWSDDAAALDVPGGLFGDVVDLTDETATREWAEVVSRRGPVDGVIHLVGGWRGGATFTDNTVADAAWLHDQVVRTTQHVSLAFFDALVASPAGRFAIVSARAVDRPTAGNAAYASAKAAAETWTLAMADGFRRAAAEGGPVTAAATIFVVEMLVDAATRAASPGQSFARATDVEDVASAVAGLWDADAAELNGARVMLAP